MVYGSSSSWPARIYLKDLDGTNGFFIKEYDFVPGGYRTGSFVNGIEDVNKDGIDDILISPNPTAAWIYVIFGSAWDTPIPDNGGLSEGSIIALAVSMGTIALVVGVPCCIRYSINRWYSNDETINIVQSESVDPPNYATVN